MTAVLYIHGFLSSPQSHKAQATRRWLTENRADMAFICPALSSYPNEAAATLKQLALECRTQPMVVIGSSLGGFWATWLVENGLAQRAVLINPAVAPYRLIADRIGIPLPNYYTQDIYTLEQQHADFLQACEQPAPLQHERYWLMVQTGDETLDYRDALAKYAGCKQTVEQQGSHTFDGYETWLPEIIKFLEN